MIRTTVLASILTLAAACGASQSSVEVRGGTEEIAMLAGQWHGSYEGLQSGRRGTITFDLEVGRHTAEGEVLMNALGAESAATPLKIKFVSVSRGAISGRIEPYMDPQCNCEVRTTFEGKVRGDAITGTFVSVPDHPDFGEQSGWWSVERNLN